MDALYVKLLVRLVRNVTGSYRTAQTVEREIELISVLVAGNVGHKALNASSKNKLIHAEKSYSMEDLVQTKPKFTMVNKISCILIVLIY